MLVVTDEQESVELILYEGARLFRGGNVFPVANRTYVDDISSLSFIRISECIIWNFCTLGT